MSLRDHLQAIYDERGELTPALVVDVARDNRHPLHTRFEWNNTIAAEKYRRVQAHDLIRSVRVNYTSPKTGNPISIRAFHAVKKDDGTRKYAYEPAAVVIQDPMIMRLLRAEMRRDWEALKRRYENFEEFWDLVESEVRVGVLIEA
jgi:hypothetical protein